MLHTVMPEEHNLSLCDLLGSGNHELHYIIKVPTLLVNMKVTYLLLYLSFLGLMSSFLNHAKYNSHGATL